MVQCSPEVDGFSNLPSSAVHEGLFTTVLDGAALDLSVRHEVTEVDALRIEVLDFEVSHDQAGDGRLDSILSRLLVSTENVDSCCHVFVAAVAAVEADILDGVVIVGDLQYTILGVTPLDTGLRVTGDSDSFVFCAVDASQTIVVVVALLEVASVSGLHFQKTYGLEVITSTYCDSFCRRRRKEL